MRSLVRVLVGLERPAISSRLGRSLLYLLKIVKISGCYAVGHPPR